MLEDKKLTDADIIKVDELHKSICTNDKLGNDLLCLLDDGVKSLKNNIFYASISVLTVVLEKFLRDELIMYEYLHNKSNDKKETVMQELDDIEEKIEDGRGKDYYNFNNICKKLCEYKIIDEKLVEELIEIYNEIRIPIQHGIYGRFIKKELGNQTVPVGVIKTNTEDNGEELLKTIKEGSKKPMNEKMNLHTSMLRMFVLPELFKNKSIYLLFVIDDLVKIIK